MCPAFNFDVCDLLKHQVRTVSTATEKPDRTVSCAFLARNEEREQGRGERREELMMDGRNDEQRPAICNIRVCAVGRPWRCGSAWKDLVPSVARDPCRRSPSGPNTSAVPHHSKHAPGNSLCHSSSDADVPAAAVLFARLQRFGHALRACGAAGGMATENITSRRLDILFLPGMLRAERSWAVHCSAALFDQIGALKLGMTAIVNSVEEISKKRGISKNEL
ncbi:hypothetical protein K438DRAFT_1773183 [Mycena galopus ATCC 62051]|nr:hypothetical protein K438DRAFT_1773183 [Mycena galopus ATCC 62051]